MEATLKVLLASLLVGPCWTLLETLVQGGAERCVHRKDGTEAPKKMVSAVTTSVSHSVQLLTWWVLVFTYGYTHWVFNVEGWAEIMMPRPWDTAERDALIPVYTIYFGFAWHSLVKDVRRSWGNLTSPDQLSFLLHHVVTVVLVAGAFKVGCWRAGVLTRLIHDPADVFLYASKFYQGLCDQGRGIYSVLASLYLINCVVWCGTRVLLYGWWMIALTGTLKMIFADPSIGAGTQAICSALYGGSLIMWTLQVLWLGALLAATRKFLASKGKETKDHLDVGQPEEKGNKKPLLA